MDIFLDSTDTKRIDLCLEFSTNYESKERRFVIKYGNHQEAFENFSDAVKRYFELP